MPVAAFQAQPAGSTVAEGPWFGGPELDVSAVVTSAIETPILQACKVDNQAQIAGADSTPYSINSSISPFESCAAFVSAAPYQSQRADPPLSAYDLETLFPVYYEGTPSASTPFGMSAGLGAVIQLIGPAVGFNVGLVRSTGGDAIEFDLYLGLLGAGLGYGTVSPSVSFSDQPATLGFSATSEAIAIIPVAGTVSITGKSLSPVETAPDFSLIHSVGFGPGAVGLGFSVGVNFGFAVGLDHQVPEINPVRLGIIPLDVPPY